MKMFYLLNQQNLFLKFLNEFINYLVYNFAMKIFFFIFNLEIF